MRTSFQETPLGASGSVSAGAGEAHSALDAQTSFALRLAVHLAARVNRITAAITQANGRGQRRVRQNFASRRSASTARFSLSRYSSCGVLMFTGPSGTF